MLGGPKSGIFGGLFPSCVCGVGSGRRTDADDAAACSAFEPNAMCELEASSPEVPFGSSATTILTPQQTGRTSSDRTPREWYLRAVGCLVRTSRLHSRQAMYDPEYPESSR